MSLDLGLARIAAKIISPARTVPDLSALQPPDHEALLDGLADNKIPLLSLAGDQEAFQGFFGDAAFAVRLGQERERWAGFRREYVVVHQAFGRAGIRDVLIKSTGIAPSLPYKSDNMDTLVAERDGPRARELLLDLCYGELKNVEEPHKFLFRKFHGGRSVSAIHLHEFVGWGTGFMQDEGVLERARQSLDDEAVWIPSPEDALLITMAHAFYEDKAIKIGDLWKVVSVLRQGELDWDAICRQSASRGWRAGLQTCILLWAGAERTLYGDHSFPSHVVAAARRQAPEYCRSYVDERLSSATSFPLGISFRFSKRHYYGKVWRDPGTSPRQKVTDICKHSRAGVERRFLFQAQRGMLVSLSGIDGSGKSVQAELLAQALDTCAIHNRTVWSRAASSPLADAVIKLVKPLLARRSPLDTVSDTREAKVLRKGLWLQRPALRAGWTALVVLDLVLRYWGRVLWQLLQGRVVIADRYIYDALVELTVLVDRSVLAEGWAARVLRWLCPRPAHAILLTVSPEIALGRKPEEPQGFLECQALVFHRMARAWGMVPMSADGDLAELCDRIVYQVLTDYYSGWGRTIKGLSWKH